MSDATARRSSARASARSRLGQLDVLLDLLGGLGPARAQLADALPGRVPRLLGPGHVDLLGQLGDPGQDGDTRREAGQGSVALGQALRSARARVDLEEPAVHGQAHRFPVGLLDLELARHHVADERRVAVEHGQVSVGGGEDHRARTAREEGLLWRDDLDAEDTVGH